MDSTEFENLSYESTVKNDDIVLIIASGRRHPLCQFAEYPLSLIKHSVSRPQFGLSKNFIFNNSRSVI